MSEIENKTLDVLSEGDEDLKKLMGDKWKPGLFEGRIPDNGEKPGDNSGYEGAFLKPCVRPVKAEAEQASTDTSGVGKPLWDRLNNPTAHDAAPAENTAADCEPDNEWYDNPDFFNKLVQCVKPAAFGFLTAVLYNWEHLGLMAEDIAVPSMIVCAVLFGLGIGKVVGKK